MARSDNGRHGATNADMPALIRGVGFLLRAERDDSSNGRRPGTDCPIRNKPTVAHENAPVGIRPPDRLGVGAVAGGMGAFISTQSPVTLVSLQTLRSSV